MKREIFLFAAVFPFSICPSFAFTESGTPSELNIQGKLVCSFSRTGAYVAFVSIVDAKDGEKYSISEPSDELKKNCVTSNVDETSFIAKGSLTPKFLFWGGNLLVTQIQQVFR